MSGDNPRPRVVFDCMVYLQATISESGPAAALLRLVDRDALSLFISNEILEEVREVLSRPLIRNLAVEVQATYIISRDKDLLDLMTGYTNEDKDFRRRFRPLKVIDPDEKTIGRPVQRRTGKNRAGISSNGSS